MFSILEDVILPISNNENNLEYTEKQKKFICTLEYEDFEKMLLILNNQNKINSMEYCMYKQSFGLEFELISYIFDKKNNLYPIIISIFNNHLILYTITPYCLYKFIQENINNRYIFLSLTYQCEDNFSHQASIMFDNKSNKIYLIDPNGGPSYFNDYVGINTENLIDHLLEKYFAELKNFGSNYEYIFTEVWNPSKIVINKNFNNDYIGSGHCVAFTFLLVHIFCILNMEPEDVYKIFESLADEEILYLISKYTSGIYNLLKI